MSLSVNAYHIDANGKWIDLETGPPEGPNYTLAGFESTRHTFYGSEKSIQLGLTILPGLANGDIYAKGEKQIAALNAEVKVLLENLDPSDDYWQFRLGNIIRAIEAAKPYGDAGMVVVW